MRISVQSRRTPNQHIRLRLSSGTFSLGEKSYGDAAQASWEIENAVTGYIQQYLWRSINLEKGAADCVKQSSTKLLSL